MCFSMEMENKNLLIQGAKTFGIHLEGKTVEAFEIYLRELLKWNQKINLTAIRSEKEIVLKHFLDSLSAHPHLTQDASLLDIGSGAGFPGIPLKIVRSTLGVTLIDSVLKKVDFQRHIIRTLGLKGIAVIHGRVQDKGILERLGGRFDIVLSRAFSDLPTFLTLGYPFLKKGGRVIAMKGEVEDKEIQSLADTESTHYRLVRIHSFILPLSPFNRTILLFKKR